jgi:hypothetical protein
MKFLIAIAYSLLTILCHAQNEAYYFTQGGMDVKRVDLDSNKIIEYYQFLDTVVLKKTPPEDLYVFTEQTQTFFSDSSELAESVVHRGVASFESPYFQALKDSFQVNDTWYTILIIQTDDHFVGGSPNRVTTDIRVEDLGIIYSSSNWMDTHMDVMICHRDSTKQKLLTSAFEYLEKKNPFVIEKSYLTRIIGLTKEYTFSTLIERLSEKWLAPGNDLKLIASHTEAINGEMHYSVTIKNISDKRYYFLYQSECGPARIERQWNDERVISEIDGAYHGARHHYHFEKINESIYLNPQDEISFNLIPNWRENCGACDQNKYFGFQIYRYGVDFFFWIFSNPVEHNGFDYTLYQLQEIK